MAARHFFNKPYDRNGKLASKGNVSERHLARWLSHPYFRQSPPKSTGRELFGEPFFKEAVKLKLAPLDLLATFTELSARTIALNYRLHLRSLPERVILCGGGAQNSHLVSRLTNALQNLSPDIKVRTTSDYGWDPQVIEPAAFALLAWLNWNKQPGNLPATTGANGPRLLGQVTSSAPPRSR